MDRGSVEESAQPQLEIDVPRRQPWAPFDAASQDAFLKLLMRGVSRNRAMKILKLNASTVNRWISLGKRTDKEWAEFGDAESRHRETLRYRTFWVEVQRAEAVADALVDTVLVDAALGTEIEHQNDDGTTTIIRVGTNWRAAEALGKRRERTSLLRDARRIKRAEADIAEANVTTAKANARRAVALAELAERGIHPVNGLLVFPSSFLDQCHDSERMVVESAMIRLGYKMASPAAVDAMAAAQSEDEVAEKEAFSARWRARLSPEEN